MCKGVKDVEKEKADKLRIEEEIIKKLLEEKEDEKKRLYEIAQLKAQIQLPVPEPVPEPEGAVTLIETTDGVTSEAMVFAFISLPPSSTSVLDEEQVPVGER